MFQPKLGQYFLTDAKQAFGLFLSLGVHTWIQRWLQFGSGQKDKQVDSECVTSTTLVPCVHVERFPPSPSAPVLSHQSQSKVSIFSCSNKWPSLNIISFHLDFRPTSTVAELDAQ